MKQLSSHRESQLPELMTAKEVAAYLSMPLVTVYYLARNGKLPGAILIGEKWRFKRQALEKYINQGMDMLSVALEFHDDALQALAEHDLVDKFAGVKRLHIKLTREKKHETSEMIITDQPLSEIGLENFPGRVITIVDHPQSPIVQGNMRAGSLSGFVTREQLKSGTYPLRQLLALVS